jgi:hypothetical protein
MAQGYGRLLIEVLLLRQSLIELPKCALGAIFCLSALYCAVLSELLCGLSPHHCSSLPLFWSMSFSLLVNALAHYLVLYMKNQSGRFTQLWVALQALGGIYWLLLSLNQVVFFRFPAVRLLFTLVLTVQALSHATHFYASAFGVGRLSAFGYLVVFYVLFVGLLILSTSMLGS